MNNVGSKTAFNPVILQAYNFWRCLVCPWLWVNVKPIFQKHILINRSNAILNSGSYYRHNRSKHALSMSNKTNKKAREILPKRFDYHVRQSLIQSTKSLDKTNPRNIRQYNVFWQLPTLMDLYPRSISNSFNYLQKYKILIYNTSLFAAVSRIYIIHKLKERF